MLHDLGELLSKPSRQESRAGITTNPKGTPAGSPEHRAHQNSPTCRRTAFPIHLLQDRQQPGDQAAVVGTGGTSDEINEGL